ncbi:hypothetical protein BO82DRAFT_398860 [Aspergillus uvarum CBS 121591]|uniref:Uncharacterized protein n=1 Tax=Aspergillus uvarum CBS 121591 TaxID=1448315 RepID=A0A319CLU4_9EURO|nr:hypothetical protein BO82DRAFT_398860 [Aspergillus uvarum CBS 121591]PYH85439.1 hypothetical protein BO82DRAFT_398860 [Aspergillus uvarum CBS 121591]
MSYLSTRTLNPPPGRISWDHRTLHPPHWVLTIMPPTTRKLIDRCYILAFNSLRAQQYVELHFAARYKALCPDAITSPSTSTDPSTNPTTLAEPAAEPNPEPTPTQTSATSTATSTSTTATATAPPPPPPHQKPHPAPQITHVQSIDRIFAWRTDYIPGDPTLAPSAKIPRSAVRFHVDRAAFAAYTARYTALLDTYLTTYYRRYREAVGAVERSLVLLRGGASTNEAGQGDGYEDKDKDGDKAREMRELDCRQLEWWWGTVFLREMMRWESRIPLLRMPGFEVVVGEVYEAVRRAVEEEEVVVWEGCDLDCEQ